jgi:hypothetical protein
MEVSFAQKVALAQKPRSCPKSLRIANETDKDLNINSGFT